MTYNKILYWEDKLIKLHSSVMIKEDITIQFTNGFLRVGPTGLFNNHSTDKNNDFGIVIGVDLNVW